MSWKTKTLTLEEQRRIEGQIAQFEKDTGAEFILAILRASDPYPAAVMRFALLFVLGLSLAVSVFFTFTHEVYLVLGQAVAIFVGLFLGRLFLFKSLCLSKVEIEREVDEKTMELFMFHGLHETQKRAAIFLLISLQEHRIKLLVDRQLKEKISQEDLDKIVVTLQENFKNSDYYRGLNGALNQVKEKVLHFFPEKVTEGESTTANELSNKIIWGDFSS